MSNGPFRRIKYETTRGDIVRGTVQPETLDLLVEGNPNSERPVFPIQEGWPSAIMRGSRSRAGIHARKIRLSLNEGQLAPDGYTGRRVEVPILTYSRFNGIVVGNQALYLGVAWTVVSKIPELIN